MSVLPDKNLSVYEQPAVVSTYVPQSRLAKAEAVLLDRHATDYQGKRVLDIGIGAGRTTSALANLAAEYLGIDYSNAMVEVCRRKFGHMENTRFLQDDARVLESCKDASFDAAIFSFNGIDTVDMEGRKAVLRAVKRILKPNGVFVFSFHNSGYLDSVYSIRLPKNPFKWSAAYRLWQNIKKINGAKAQYQGRDYFFIKDGAEDFQLDICYLKPSFQLQMLKDYGFRLEECLESHTGRPLRPEDADASRVPWIYLRCVSV